MTESGLVREINALIGYLVEVGLSSDQNYAQTRTRPPSAVEVSFRGSDHVSIALRNHSYRDIYHHLARERAFVAKLPDGALIQMMYLIDGDQLVRHRLAFFPSPDLEEFQNNPEIYLQDELYAEVVSRNVVPFPVRFDYSAVTAETSSAHHPKSHLTLGQYQNCRIPVSSPMSPSWFIDFVLRNFYHTSFTTFADKLPRARIEFTECIHADDRALVHLVVPAGAAC